MAKALAITAPDQRQLGDMASSPQPFGKRSSARRSVVVWVSVDKGNVLRWHSGAGRGRSFETETNAAIAGRQVNVLSNNTQPIQDINTTRSGVICNANAGDTLPAPEAQQSEMSDSVMKNVSREKLWSGMFTNSPFRRLGEVLPSPYPQRGPEFPASPALFFFPPLWLELQQNAGNPTKKLVVRTTKK